MVSSDRQRKKNITLLVSLVVLICASILVGMYSGSSSSLKIDESMFRIEDFAAIDSIVMKSDDTPVSVHYDGRRWRVNNAYPADRDLVEVLFATLQQAVPKRPVAEGLRDSIAQVIEAKGVDVALFSDGDVRKVFRVGADAAQSETWFMGEDDTPYVMTIPGYRVFVAGILSLRAPQWRDKFIFGFNATNFKQLKASFPGDSRQGYTISMTDQGPSVEGMVEADTTRLFDFLDHVARLTVDEFGKSHPDSVFLPPPVMEIVVTDIANRTYSLSLYRPGKMNGAFGGIVHGGDTASLDARKVDQVLKSRDFFSPGN